MRSKILDIHNKLKDDKKYIYQLIDLCINNDKKYNFTNSTLANNYDNAKKYCDNFEFNDDNYLCGIPYSLKDNICTKDIITTGGSKFYKNFIPPYNAFVYKSLLNNNSILINKANCDEFGLGGTGLYSGFGYVKNWKDEKYITGGSSSGCANHVSSNTVVFSIGTDTGDSIRRPASLMGIVGYKPTYGLISRYGIFSYSSSLDTVGIFSNYVTDCAIVAQYIIEFDNRDFTSQKLEHDFFNNLQTKEKINIGIINNIENFLNIDVKNIYLEYIEKLASKFNVIKLDIDFELMKCIDPTYTVISYGEATSNHASDTSVQAGEFDNSSKNYSETLFNSRNNNYGDELKRRFVIGSYVTKSENFEHVFQRTKKIRTLLNNSFNNLLNQVDCLILPGCSSFAPTISDIEHNKFSTTLADDLLQLANFNGSPSITIPYYKKDVNCFGININTKQFEDQKLFDIALTLEEFFENE